LIVGESRAIDETKNVLVDKRFASKLKITITFRTVEGQDLLRSKK
jgi:hypothetical protein